MANQIAFALLCVLVGVLIGVVGAFGYIIFGGQEVARRKVESDEKMADMIEGMFKTTSIKSNHDHIVMEDGDKKLELRKLTRKYPVKVRVNKAAQDESDSTTGRDRERDQDN